ncbi:hypothetical protein LO771_25965 [Streptacidiphilus sp. ASG 303]|uniref:hypothetical protein n=1 Tax=Streptacidiphilus sp. ASG 303 TaxID=2896847 RepID=UPI001E3AD0E9|nr:hypothetical protein [Streptacidiphilus sp. ASG 303]MCD0485741.1 hypothetical protein [Streptacidiphilus sp. ASG 303]
MSINSRAVAAAGAVVVVSAGLVGWGVATAAGEDKPVNRMVTVVAGSNTANAEPTCWNDGKPLDGAAQQRCQANAAKQEKDGKLKSVEVTSGSRIGVGVDPAIADKGWFAFTDGGAQGQATLASARRTGTFSGLVPASTVLKSTGKTLVTVVEADTKNQEIYGVWYFTLKNKDA